MARPGAMERIGSGHDAGTALDKLPPFWSLKSIGYFAGGGSLDAARDSIFTSVMQDFQSLENSVWGLS
jgi:hypothetical protein